MLTYYFCPSAYRWTNPYPHLLPPGIPPCPPPLQPTGPKPIINNNHKL